MVSPHPWIQCSWPLQRIYTQNQQANVCWHHQEHTSQTLMLPYGNNVRDSPQTRMWHTSSEDFWSPSQESDPTKRARANIPLPITTRSFTHTMSQGYPLTDHSPGSTPPIYPSSLPLVWGKMLSNIFPKIHGMVFECVCVREGECVDVCVHVSLNAQRDVKATLVIETFHYISIFCSVSCRRHSNISSVQSVEFVILWTANCTPWHGADPETEPVTVGPYRRVTVGNTVGKFQKCRVSEQVRVVWYTHYREYYSTVYDVIVNTLVKVMNFVIVSRELYHFSIVISRLQYPRKIPSLSISSGVWFQNLSISIFPGKFSIRVSSGVEWISPFRLGTIWKVTRQCV
jgi:hypothetical protein